MIHRGISSTWPPLRMEVIRSLRDFSVSAGFSGSLGLLEEPELPELDPPLGLEEPVEVPPLGLLVLELPVEVPPLGLEAPVLAPGSSAGFSASVPSASSSGVSGS